ncbi:hypothetical protein AURDEDRAFT_110257 [Auricularia subglabra TFB-10046 SS5]|nr:hypothetical protein AURDEDRAFT_110257 [Auricularia subglabra TFB-10046 SS5]
MSWQDSINRWRTNVKPGAPAAPSVVATQSQSKTLHARSRSVPPPPRGPPSDAMTSISRRPPNPRAPPDPLPPYAAAAQPRRPITRMWPPANLASPSSSRSRSRSSGTPPAPAPGARRYAQPAYPPPVVPVVPMVPVSPPGGVVHIQYPPSHQPVILVQSPPATHYYPVGSTAMATASSPPDLGERPCPSCNRSIPTLQLRSHLARTHGWRV